MRNATTLAIALVAGAGGYVLRGRPQPTAKLPPSSTIEVASEVTRGAPEAARRAATSRAPADYQALENQLAICMAFHPSADETEKQLQKQLGMCQAQLDGYRHPRPSLPSCYDFMDFAPIYDRELGEANPSPETLERAKNMTAEACVEVLTWQDRASRQLAACIEGETPPGFKDKYGSPIDERPLVKACHSDALRRAAFDAWYMRDEARTREMGHEPLMRVRMNEDGGVETEMAVLPGFRPIVR